MCLQSFFLGKADNLIADGFQSLVRIIDDTGFLDKIIHRKRREKFRRSVGRKHMVRACKIISERFGRILSEENRTGIFDLRHGFKRILCYNFKMFGCDVIDYINGFLHGRGNKHVTVTV